MSNWQRASGPCQAGKHTWHRVRNLVSEEAAVAAVPARPRFSREAVHECRGARSVKRLSERREERARHTGEHVTRARGGESGCARRIDDRKLSRRAHEGASALEEHDRPGLLHRVGQGTKAVGFDLSSGHTEEA